MRKVVLAAALALYSIPETQAQDAVEGTEADYYVQSAGGQPAVCGIEATVLYRDKTYRRGAHSAVRVFLTWLEDKGNISVILKLAGIDDPASSPHIFKVNYGHVGINGENITPYNTFTCEDANNFCGGYWLPNSELIYIAAMQGKLSIGFNRYPNGLDVSLPLDARPTLKNASGLAEFNQCIVILGERAAKAIR
jgi:hypothetical protein